MSMFFTAGTVVCAQSVTEGLLTNCGHFFCRECVDRILADVDRKCPMCRKKISKRRLFRVSGHSATTSSAAVGDVDGVMAIPIKGDFGTKVGEMRA